MTQMAAPYHVPPHQNLEKAGSGGIDTVLGAFACANCVSCVEVGMWTYSGPMLMTTSLSIAWGSHYE